MHFSDDRKGARAVMRAEREITALAAFHHPNIVGLVDVFSPASNQLAIVMDYVEGESLVGLLPELSPAQFLLVFRQIASALARVHRNGITHRDVKPSNILVSWPYAAGEPHAVLIDFGIALRAEDGTEAGFLGSPAYASPEQAIGGEVGPPSDVFSLGLIAYEAVTKIAPFLSDSIDESLSRHAAWRRPSLEAFSGFQYPQAVCSLIEDMLEVDPRERPEMSEVASRTDRALGYSEVLKGSDLSEPSGGLAESSVSEATVDVLERNGDRVWVEADYLRVRRRETDQVELYALQGLEPVVAIATDDGVAFSLTGGEVVLTDGLTEIRREFDRTVVQLIELADGGVEVLTADRNRFAIAPNGDVSPLPRRDRKVS